MRNLVPRTLSRLGVLFLVLVVGIVIGGGVTYALIESGYTDPIAAAQEEDPDHVTIILPNDLEETGPGIVIASVVPDSPADEAGVERGDILLEIDGQVLEQPGDLSHLYSLDPGDEVELTVLHGDDERTLTATLGEQGDRAYLGVAPCAAMPPLISRHMTRPGAIVIEVTPDSPADEAGLQEGDLVLAVDGQEIDVGHGLADLVAAHEPGDTVTLEIERLGEEPQELVVELGQHPEHEDRAYLGVRYDPLPAAWAMRSVHSPGFPALGLPHLELLEGETLQGVFVQYVHDDTPGADAGLEQGDVIVAIDGVSIESVDDLISAIAGYEPGDMVTLTVQRSGSAEEIEATLGEHPDGDGKAYLGISIGSHIHIEQFEGGVMPHRFRFFGRPCDGESPHFEFHWVPSEEGHEGCPGCSGCDL